MSPKGVRGPGPGVSGWALLADAGVLFIGRATEPTLRRLLFHTDSVQLLRAEQAQVTTFPASLLLDRLDAVRELTDVHWLSVTEKLIWKGDGDEEQVSLAVGRLSVRVDGASRTLLRTMFPSP